MTYWDPQNAPDVEDTDDPAELVDIDIAMNREAFEASEAARQSFDPRLPGNEPWSGGEDNGYDVHPYVDEDADRGDR